MTEYGFNPFSDSIKLKQDISAFKKIERLTPAGTSTEIDVENPILFLNESSIASPVFDGSIPRLTRRTLLWSIVDGRATIGANIGCLIKLYDNDLASYVWHTVTDIIIDSPTASDDPEDILTPNYIIITFLGDGIDGSMRYDSPESTYVTTASESWGDKTVGTAGWILSSEGNAIFNNVAIRGEIEATSLSINSNEAGDSTTTGIYWTGDPDDPLYIGADVNILGTVTAEALTLNDYNYWTPTLTGADFRVGGATSGILWDGTTFEIKGDLVTGTIGASSGGINGWNISEGLFASGETTTYVALSASPSNTYSIWAGGETASTAPFSVKRDGTLSATNATIEGEITATTIDIGGTDGIVYDGTTVTIGTDVEITGGVTATSFAIDADNYWNTPGNEGVFSSNSGKLGNWTLNDEEIFSDISDIDNTYRTGIKAATGIGGGTYTPSIFYMVHDHDSPSAIPSFNSPNTPFYVDSNGKFSLADKLYFDQDINNPSGIAQLTVIGKIRGQIENTALAESEIPNSNAETITQIEITAIDTAVITAATHGFSVDDTVIISGLTTTELNGAWKVFSVTTNTFTIKSEGLTISAAYADSGLARIRELTLGLHPAVGASPAGLGIRLDEYNYWFVNNKFRIGGSENYVDWSGSQLEVKGTINDLELGRGGGNIYSNFAVGIGALGNNISGGSNNVALGQNALGTNTTGFANLAIGYESLLNNVSGSYLVAIGSESLRSNTIASNNIGIGYRSLRSNTRAASLIAIGAFALENNDGDSDNSESPGGVDNIAIGGSALRANTSGRSNIAIGSNSLSLNTTGIENLAIGYTALSNNTTGIRNTAIGSETLYSNISGYNNVAIGNQALYLNKSNYNLAIGDLALQNNETGEGNFAIGSSALNSNKNGFANIAIGTLSMSANVSGNQNVAIGSQTLGYNKSGSSNVAIGFSSLISNVSGSNNIAIGNFSLKNNFASNNVAIGNGALGDNTNGFENLAIGSSSLGNNETGNYNIAIGSQSLNDNSSDFNLAIGYQSLLSNSIGQNNLALGYQSLSSNTTGSYNLAIGSSALKKNTIGVSNLAIGYRSLELNTEGTSNIAIGPDTLRSNSTGSSNIAIGSGALNDNTIGQTNIAIGESALGANTTGVQNIAIGNNALVNNQTGISNIAIGTEALQVNSSNGNIAIGLQALQLNTTGSGNLAIGNSVLSINTIGSQNISLGQTALYQNISGNYNIALGYEALRNNLASHNVAIGLQALRNNTVGTGNVAFGASSAANNTSGSYNIAFGYEALNSNTTASGSIAIGYKAASLNRNSGSVAIGYNALVSNTTGEDSLAIGYEALKNNQTSSFNLAIGYLALTLNNGGISNLAIGSKTLSNNTSGSNNLAIGYTALQSNTIGSDNVAIGLYALKSNINGVGNLAVGNSTLQGLVSGSTNTVIGGNSFSGSNKTASGNTGVGYGVFNSAGNAIENSALGQLALRKVSGTGNTAVGYFSGGEITTGSKNVIVGSNDGSTIATSSNNIIISDGDGNIRIQSDSGGRVTMPNTPAFSVYSSFVSTQSGNLTYNATNSNNGGHMNLGTGLFTAPVSGYYHFNYYGFIDTGLSGNTTITFQKNGAGFPSRAYNDFNDASYGPVISLSAVIYLATNDNVRVNITGAGVHGNDSSFFSGFLIG